MTRLSARAVNLQNRFVVSKSNKSGLVGSGGVCVNTERCTRGVPADDYECAWEGRKEREEQ